MNWRKLFLSDEYLTWMKDIRSRPDDNLPRLVFADWLEERGDDIYCHFIRQQCGLGCVECGGTGKVPRGYCDAFMYSCDEHGIEDCVHKKELVFCVECRGTGKELASKDTNGKPSERQIAESFVRREVIEQVMPIIAGSYKFSRGFISEVSVSTRDFIQASWEWSGNFRFLWEVLRCTQPLFDVVIEPTSFVINNGERHTIHGRFAHTSYYQRVLDEECIFENGDVSPIVKWCIR